MNTFIIVLVVSAWIILFFVYNRKYSPFLSKYKKCTIVYSVVHGLITKHLLHNKGIKFDNEIHNSIYCKFICSELGKSAIKMAKSVKNEVQ